jgi:hypothetical protein
MEGPIAADIFATKGIEYLLVIGFLLAFIVFIRALFRGGRKREDRDKG